jgi:hypothetical protein
MERGVLGGRRSDEEVEVRQPATENKKSKKAHDEREKQTLKGPQKPSARIGGTNKD